MVTSVSESIVIEGVAPADVFEHLTDTSNHASDSGAMHVVGPIGPTRLTGKGDRFGMRMRAGPIPYRIVNTVVEFEQDRLVAWRHFGGHRWRYELESVGDGTQVTETFDLARVPTIAHPVYATAFGFPDAYRRNMQGSLAALRDTLTT